MSSVVDVCSCPITFRTTLTGTPSVTSQVAYECRRSWNRRPPPASFATWSTASRSVARHAAVSLPSPVAPRRPEAVRRPRRPAPAARPGPATAARPAAGSCSDASARRRGSGRPASSSSRLVGLPPMRPERVDQERRAAGRSADRPATSGTAGASPQAASPPRPGRRGAGALSRSTSTPARARRTRPTAGPAPAAGRRSPGVSAALPEEAARRSRPGSIVAGVVLCAPVGRDLHALRRVERDEPSPDRRLENHRQRAVTADHGASRSSPDELA